MWAFLLPVVVGQTRVADKDVEAWVSEQNRVMGKVEEKKLLHWKPQAANLVAPPTRGLIAKLDVSGSWQGLGTTFKLFPKADGSYVMEFSTGGCLGGWSLQRTAKFTNGELLLDRPVAEYAPATYRRLFALRSGGVTYLVPDCNLGRFSKFPAFNGFVRQEARIPFPA